MIVLVVVAVVLLATDGDGDVPPLFVIGRRSVSILTNFWRLQCPIASCSGRTGKEGDESFTTITIIIRGYACQSIIESIVGRNENDCPDKSS
jgi:hypothetical protein